MNLVEVFHNTVDTYNTAYQKETEQLVKDTRVYVNKLNVVYSPVKMNLSVTNEGTVSAGRRIFSETHNKTAILNFADGIVPGGLVLSGAATQEENICRCSNLYASISNDGAKSLYYNPNALTRGRYYDTVIYSPNVTFFKDDETYERVDPYVMDVITCPAPSCSFKSQSEEYSTIYFRIEQILKSAIKNDVRNIVLGAWGCGAFGQNPNVVALCFKTALMDYFKGAFDNVIFAIRTCDDDYATHTTGNLAVFRRVFDEC